ncbi:MAG: TolC family outer membrane protein [Sulfitobacter sp.]|nr:TolC family outer membrane protein [Sulfitobacter sp.]
MTGRTIRKFFGAQLLCGALALTGSLGLPRVLSAETLADALVGAYTHSGLLEQNRALLRAADEDVAQAASALKPVLRWSATATQSFSRAQTAASVTAFSNNDLTAALNLVVEQLLYDFGASSLRVEATKETVLATRDGLTDIEQQVLLRAVIAYMGVIEASEFVALRENNVRLLTQELQAARDRFEVGEVTRTDVALAEAQLAQARSGLAGAKGDLMRASEEYRNVVGRAPGILQPPPGLPNLPNTVDAAKALAVRVHPALEAVQHQVAAADLLVRAGEADLKPTIRLRGSLGVQENLSADQYNRNATIGVEAGQIIYQGGALSSIIRQRIARAQSVRGNLHTVRNDIQQDVGNAYANLGSTRAQLEASARQVRAARIAFQGIREEATLGARTTLDVLDAEQALLDALSLQVSARSNLYVAAYAVLASTGQMTAQKLGLPVQIYDPAGYYNLVKDAPAKLSKQGEQLDRVIRALGKD